MLERCAACGVPLALVGRAHRCVPRSVPAEQARPQAPDTTDGRPRPVDAGGEPPARRRPKRDRAAYMRRYRASKRGARAQ